METPQWFSIPTPSTLLKSIHNHLIILDSHLKHVINPLKRVILHLHARHNILGSDFQIVRFSYCQIVRFSDCQIIIFSYCHFKGLSKMGVITRGDGVSQKMPKISWWHGELGKEKTIILWHKPMRIQDILTNLGSYLVTCSRKRKCCVVLSLVKKTRALAVLTGNL